MKSQISYDRTMYVRVLDRALFDEISTELYPLYAKGDDNLCITWEGLTSYIDEEANAAISSDAHKLILEVYNSAQGEIGDVVFVYRRSKEDKS